jgi:hypothetical protein
MAMKPPLPSPAQQKQIISKLEDEEESVHVYTVSKKWHENWKAYVGISDSSTCDASKEPQRRSAIFDADINQFIADKSKPSATSPKAPGPLTMDTEKRDGNLFVDEKIWKQWVSWYGISAEHQLDRRNWSSAETQYEICILNPYSGVIHNALKTFDANEEAGYVEVQLRRVFGVARHRATRLWLCERARNARFRPLLNRAHQLSMSKEEDRDYILALEIANHDRTWPTCSPGEPQGSLDVYAELTEGPKTQEFWEAELSSTVDSVFRGIASELQETVGGLVQTTKCITAAREKELGTAKALLDQQLHSVAHVQRTFEDKVKDIIRQEETIKAEAKRLRRDRDNLDQERNRLAKEMLQMEELNKITESRVRLDVGGHVFTTSLLTLTKDPSSMLSAMFSGRHSITREADGSFFIDRDGTYFRYILNFLRDGGFRPGTLPPDAQAR